LTRLLSVSLVVLACAVGSPPSARTADGSNNELVQLIVELVTGSDRDMRTLGFQQIREEAKGAAATKRFADLLPKLPADAQVGLLDALADRGDATARPAVLEMHAGKEEAVRAASLRALGSLGEVGDVPLLAGKMAAGTAAESAAAERSLVRLRGKDVDAAIAAQLKEAPASRPRLLSVLATRTATGCIGAVLQSAEDPDAKVRLAALGALRLLADEKQTPALVKLLKVAGDDQERCKAELALLAVASRNREACVDGLLAGLAGAAPSARISLLKALARSGGEKALEAVVAATKDKDQELQDEAVRLLASWPQPAAAPYLLTIAKQSASPRHNAVAVQGLLRLAAPSGDRPADLGLLTEAIAVAKRPEEKRLAVGILGGIPKARALALVRPLVDNPAVAEEALLAAVLIVEKAMDVDQDQRRGVLHKAAKAKTPSIRERAAKAVGKGD
jgi:HEAT repeat protein